MALIFKNTIQFSMIFFFFTVGLNAQNAEIELKNKLFFEAFHKKDTIVLKSLCHEKCSFKSITQNSKSEELQTISLSTFFKDLSKIPSNITFEEKIIDTRIVSDELIAHVWMNYEFYVQGKLSHSGVNSIQWIFQNNEWKIIDITDSRIKP